MTYAEDGRVIGDSRPLILLSRNRSFFDAQVLHIATTKHNILVDLVRRCNLFLWILLASFGTEGGDILEGDG